MTTTDTYDVAVIGYGPTGATAANLLGQLGLKVLVVERDPDVYGRARAISTDEEVMRVWQSVGLADRLQQDMLPDRPLNFVDADGAPFIDLEDHFTRNGTSAAAVPLSARGRPRAARGGGAVPERRGAVGTRMPATQYQKATRSS